MLGNLIVGFVIILIGVTLAPTIANAVTLSLQNGTQAGNLSPNFSGTSQTLLQLTPLFYNLAIAVIAIDIAIIGLRNAGLMM
jgi:hypothetical protein